jgi:hypothetical protein
MSFRRACCSPKRGGRITLTLYHRIAGEAEPKLLLEDIKRRSEFYSKDAITIVYILFAYCGLCDRLQRLVT